MGDKKKNISDKQKKETAKPNPAKNVHAPSLPVKSHYSYYPSNLEKRDKEQDSSKLD